MAESQRIQQVQEVLQAEVGGIVSKTLDVPEGAIVTVTAVDASPDLTHADVYISVRPAEKAEDTVEQLQDKISTIQRNINKRLSMRPVPKLVFRQDTGAENANRIEQTLEQLRQSGEL